MAEGRLRFGTQRSADVKLFLIDPDDKNYEKNPVHLHSQILRRFKCFEGKFSKRWPPLNIAAELWVSTSHNFDHYLKCIEIMYGEPVNFLNIEECLAILSVSSEMLADECVNECMQYLEAVPWSAEEEYQIREVLSSERLKLKISPDLAARLHEEDENEHINFVKESMQEMVILFNGELRRHLSSNREIVEKYLEGLLEKNASRDVADACGRALVQEFRATVDSHDFSTLTRLFKLIQRCNGGILEAAFRAFCENAELVQYLNHVYTYSTISYAEVLFDIITWFMKATGDGKIIISKASRVTLLTTWLPMAGIIEFEESIEDKVFKEFEKAVLKVVKSLPPEDQKHICLVWAKVYRSKRIDIATPLTLAAHLQLALSKPATN